MVRLSSIAATTKSERWLLDLDGQAHVVQIDSAELGHRITWLRDGEQVATRRSSDSRVVLDGGEAGAMRAQLAELVGPARRVTLYAPGSSGQVPALAAAQIGVGGVDLRPEPGSRAAAREAWIRAHPRQYVVRRTAGAAAVAVLSVLALWALQQIEWPKFSIPWPTWQLPTIDLPDIPWPQIPWPDISIPWPDVDLPGVPAWIQTAAQMVKFVWPVLLAGAIASAEIRRRRAQDRRRSDPERDDRS